MDQRGGLYGAVRQANGGYDVTMMRWESTKNRYSRGYAAPTVSSLQFPGSADAGSPTGASGDIGGSPPATQPATPDGDHTVWADPLSTPSAFRADDKNVEEQEPQAKATRERRQAYEEKARQAFKNGEYRVAVNALGLAEAANATDLAMSEMATAEKDPDDKVRNKLLDDKARIRLLLFYTHIATEEDAQAITDLAWLSSPEMVRDERGNYVEGPYRGLRALKDPKEIMAMYSRSSEFAKQQARLRLLPVSRYDCQALNAMMAWASGDMAEARRLAVESQSQFRELFKAGKKSLDDIPGIAGNGPVERSNRAMYAWPDGFRPLMETATKETGGSKAAPSLNR